MPTFSTPTSDLPICPACRNPMMSTPSNKCPLCGFALDALEAVSDDTTPYADAAARRYWKMMCWVIFAGSYRLSHLARMRRSRSSLRFAALSLSMLGLAGALAVLPSHGWERIEDRGASYPQGYPEPAGNGWQLIGKLPRPPGLTAGELVMVRLWWNPGLWAVSILVNFVCAFSLGWLLILWVTVRSNRALLAEYRDEKRFTAAIDYCTANVPILLLAAAIYGSSVFQTLGRIQQWEVEWPRYFHTVPAYLLGGFGLFVMWFWLLRMAHTAPPATSARAGRYFGLWAPLFTVVLFGGWIVGQHHAMPYMARLLRMNFCP